MESWWNLGEWSGTRGVTLAVYSIPCRFCGEVGNFSTEFHAEKNSQIRPRFSTLTLSNVETARPSFRSAGENLHSFYVQPWPRKVNKAPDEYPEAIGRFWLQAKRNLKDGNWDAAAVMARSALQLSLRSNDAKGANLKQEIDDLASKGVLPPIMRDWAHNVRELGNDSAHPNPEQPATSPKDASDIVGFLDFLLEYLYKLPKKINEYRGRKDV